MKTHLIRLALVCFLCSCAHGPSPSASSIRARDFKNQKIEPEARVPFFQAERLYSLRKYEEAKAVYLSVKTKYPKSRAHLLSSYRLGTIMYYQEDYPAATREFEYFLAKYPDSELSFDVTYNWAAALFQQGQYEKAHQALARLRPNDIQAQGPRRAEVVYQLSAQVAEARGDRMAALMAYTAQLQLPLGEESRMGILDNVDKYLSRIDSATELTRLSTQITEPMTRAKIAARLNALESQRVARVAAPVPVTVPIPSSSPSVPPVVESPEEPIGMPLGPAMAGDRLSVGVVLPLTGKFSAYGKKALDGVMLAAGIFNTSRTSDFRIFIEDTASSPSLAQQAVDTLFYDKHVVAIIGPLNAREAVTVADRAQQLGVLNLSLSAKEGISGRGAYLFQNALTPRVQLESLVQHCTQQKGFRRFAILSPSDNFGRDMTENFWELAERNQAKIVAYHTYAPEEKDFQWLVRELTGLANLKYRRQENTKLGEYLQEQKQKTGKEPKSTLPPLVDFDAIFVPDTPKNVASLAASLAYFEVSGAPLLGTTEWNSDQLFKRGGRYVEGAIFPGGVSLATRNVRQREFIREYSEAYGSLPDLLAGQAYEAMELIALATTKSTSGNRNEIAQTLASVRDHESLLGMLSFDGTRTARRKLPIYSLTSTGNFVEQN